MSMLDPKTFDMFYFTGSKHTTPNCPIDLKPDLNPSSGAQSYEGSDVDCSRNALYNIPFFLENLGPRFSEWSVNAHEARPGHHTQVRKTIPCPTLAPPVREIISVLCTRHQVCARRKLCPLAERDTVRHFMTPTLSGLSHFAVLLGMLVFQVKVKKMVFSINHSSWRIKRNHFYLDFILMLVFVIVCLFLDEIRPSPGNCPYQTFQRFKVWKPWDCKRKISAS